MSVIMPPRIEAKESGIRVRPGLRWAFSEACRSRGIKSASAATLFITADRAADTPAMTLMCRRTLRVPSSRAPAIISIAPERYSPRLMISTSAMIMTAG